ncbi:uncharacterized protein LOC111076916 [Drosophila obscura]|uniref:uncharacterized protein LOC111076916 n=1 Tax=Drosophila obscura TaxID=7282 RepID=UPI001BB2A2A5|nr:uncharacterized protein LOC111076916 [Drosophila obscura]
MYGTMPDVICCKCGSLPHGLPYCIGGTGQEYHCFCCLKPPPQKCIYCNSWRDIDLCAMHTDCVQGQYHVFVSTEPWPPFPSETPNIPVMRAPTPELLVPIRFDPEQEVPMSRTEVEYNAENFAHDPEETIVLDDDCASSETEDVKPPRKPLQEPDWYSVQEIKQWYRCIRCNKEKKAMAGWIKHAQKCGQDPNINAKKFFIYNHINGWCNYQVLDSRWDIHSSPKIGSCRICRNAREHGNPLPYMSKPPTRPNESKLAAQRLRNRRMRKHRRMTRLFSPSRNLET